MAPLKHECFYLQQVVNLNRPEVVNLNRSNWSASIGLGWSTSSVFAYDVKIEHYRTPIVNEAIAYIADLSKGSAENKNGNSHLFVENSRSVARGRIELPTSGL